MAVRKKKTIEWLLKKYSWLFNEFDLDEATILYKYENYKSKQSDSVEDFFWSIVNYLLLESGKNAQDLIDFYAKSEKIYLVMVHFRRDYEKQPSNKLHKIWVEHRVNLNIESSSLELNFKIMAGANCEASKPFDGKIITKEEALKNNTIPYNLCDRPTGCICLLSAIVKKDANGRITRKIQ